MVYPQSLESNVGLAGPTADIGHETAHGANGIPATLYRVQQALGTEIDESVWVPSWRGGGAPATNTVRWSKVGNIICVSWEFRWTALHTVTASGNNLWDGAFPWGTFRESYLMGVGNFVSGGASSVAALNLKAGPYGAISGYSSFDTQNTFSARTQFPSGSYFLGSGVLAGT